MRAAANTVVLVVVVQYEYDLIDVMLNIRLTMLQQISENAMLSSGLGRQI